ncbi:hypothetical protein DRN34_00005 [Thermococci archaeon]|nr:MAG: hypothetical protein DRN34_00005 [Thermococci archaeon]
MDPILVIIVTLVTLVVLAAIYKDVSAFILMFVLLGIWTLLMLATASICGVTCFIVDKIKRTQ